MNAFTWARARAIEKHSGVEMSLHLECCSCAGNNHIYNSNENRRMAFKNTTLRSTHKSASTIEMVNRFQHNQSIFLFVYISTCGCVATISMPFRISIFSFLLFIRLLDCDRRNSCNRLEILHGSDIYVIPSSERTSNGMKCINESWTKFSFSNTISARPTMVQSPVWYAKYLFLVCAVLRSWAHEEEIRGEWEWCTVYVSHTDDIFTFDPEENFPINEMSSLISPTSKDSSGGSRFEMPSLPGIARLGTRFSGRSQNVLRMNELQLIRIRVTEKTFVCSHAYR